jgi:hypothetical protein
VIILDFLFFVIAEEALPADTEGVVLLIEMMEIPVTLPSAGTVS